MNTTGKIRENQAVEYLIALEENGAKKRYIALRNGT